VIIGLVLLFVIINRGLFFPLPLHGDIGFFGPWGHFKGEKLNHNLIMHNGGFRSAALYCYWIYKMFFGFLGAKYFSRLGLLLTVLLSFAGYQLLFENLGMIEFFPWFALVFAILISGFSSGVVYIYSVELVGICFLPFIYLLFFYVSLPFCQVFGLALFLALLFKLNLSFEVTFFYLYMFWFKAPSLQAFVLHSGLGVLIASILYLAYLGSIGALKFSVSGFLAFFKCRNSSWYAYKRLFWPFLRPMLIEYLLPLVLCIAGGIQLILAKQFLFPGLLAVSVFGLVLQRGFFHYHYTCLFPSIALVASGAIYFCKLDMMLLIPVIILYTGFRVLHKNKQFWPKPLIHQEIYNRLVDELKDTSFRELIEKHEVSWFAGWRFQFHLVYNSRPFSVFLQTVKFMMVFDEEDEKLFYPEFSDVFLERMGTVKPSLLILEEDELIDLSVLQKMGFEVKYQGTYKGRLKFFTLEGDINLPKEQAKECLKSLFVRYPANFELTFFKRIMPQYLMQCNQDESIFLVGENKEQKELLKVFNENGFDKVECLSRDEFESRKNGTFFLIDEGRINTYYMGVHQRIGHDIRMFKFT
jgi:hypothetical protein